MGAWAKPNVCLPTLCTPCQTGCSGRLQGSWSGLAAPGSCWIWRFGLDEAGSWQRWTKTPAGPPRLGARSAQGTKGPTPGEENERVMVRWCNKLKDDWRGERKINKFDPLSVPSHRILTWSGPFGVTQVKKYKSHRLNIKDFFILGHSKYFCCAIQ